MLLAALVAVIGGSVGVGFALASSSSNVTVKTFAADKVAINKYLQNDLQFKPGTITGAHKSIRAVVLALAGTFYFVCAVHVWMQGKIVVG